VSANPPRPPLLHRLGNAPWPVLVGWLTLCFSLFGIASLNLFLMLRANVRFIAEHGLDALAEGGALQFVLLAGTAYVAMAFYTLAKWFEYRLMDRMAGKRPPATAAAATAASSARTTTTRHSPPPARRPSSVRLRRAGARPARSGPR
jgi:hypothetical protein